MNANLKVEIEHAPEGKNAVDFCKLLNVLNSYASCYATRNNIALIIRQHGFGSHVGGKHVAVLGLQDPSVRFAVVTGTTPDFI